MFSENQVVLLPQGTTLISYQRGEKTSNIGLDLAVFTTASSMSQFHASTGVVCNKWLSANCFVYPLMPYEQEKLSGFDITKFARIVLKRDKKVKIYNAEDSWYYVYYLSRKPSGFFTHVATQSAPISKKILDAIALPYTKSN